MKKDKHYETGTGEHLAVSAIPPGAIAPFLYLDYPVMALILSGLGVVLGVVGIMLGHRNRYVVVVASIGIVVSFSLPGYLLLMIVALLNGYISPG